VAEEVFWEITKPKNCRGTERKQGMQNLKTKYLDLPDIRIAYSEHGEGPTLLLLHGNSESKGIFMKYQTEHFKSFHTFALDSRGHGQSKSKDAAYSIEQYSQDVIQFCHVLGIEKASVIGYSDGGNISLFLGLKAPETFKRIIAISPNTLVSGTTDKALKMFTNIYKVFQFLSKLGVNTTNFMMRFDLMLNDIGLYEKDLHNIKTNLRILYAENDMIKEDHILYIHGNVPGSSVQKIDHCTHLNILESMNAIQDMHAFLD
jgi:pimeloyl-ACP methyl ester carboxylesterase